MNSLVAQLDGRNGRVHMGEISGSAHGRIWVGGSERLCNRSCIGFIEWAYAQNVSIDKSSIGKFTSRSRTCIWDISRATSTTMSHARVSIHAWNNTIASLRSDISAACVVGFCRCRLLGLRGGSIAVRLAPHSLRYAPLIYRIQLEAANRDAVVLHHEYQNKKSIRRSVVAMFAPSGHN